MSESIRVYDLIAILCNDWNPDDCIIPEDIEIIIADYNKVMK